MTASVFQQLYQLIRQHYPNYANLWQQTADRQGMAWEAEFSRHISRVFGSTMSEAWEAAVDGYAEYCTDALRAQLVFEKHRRYPASSYAEVNATCYQNPDYMMRRYLPGMYLSHYIWPHHHAMLNHFRNALLPRIQSEVQLFYEVGVGCGMYSLQTLEHVPQAHGVGFDISQYALDFTLDVIQRHGYGDRYTIRNQDILLPPRPVEADLVISQEVLEHLEDPPAFIRGLYDMTRPGGWGYITAAINAAHTDHIYLYRSPDEVYQQIEAAGWHIQDSQIEFNYPDKPVEIRPTIAGFLAQKPA